MKEDKNVAEGKGEVLGGGCTNFLTQKKRDFNKVEIRHSTYNKTKNVPFFHCSSMFISPKLIHSGWSIVIFSEWLRLTQSTLTRA